MIIDRTGDLAHDADVTSTRRLVAEGCRVLAARRLAPGILGHISVRLPSGLVAVRCRGPRERGLAHTSIDDIRVLEIDESPAEPETADDYVAPYELPLHLSVLAHRPDVDCVVHAHPRDVVAADLAGLALVPVVGAYDIPGAALAAAGIPVYPRSVLVHNGALGAEVAEHLGGQAVVVMRGHGLTATGGGVEEAVLRAASVNEIASISLAVAQAGGRPVAIPPDDMAELPDLGSSLNLGAAWRHELTHIAALDG